MGDHSFRIRFTRSPTDKINVESSSLEFFPPNSEEPIVLSSSDQNTTIQKADSLVLRGVGWSSEEEAASAGEKYQNALLQGWRILFKQVAFEIGREGLKDDEIIPLLH